MIASRSDLLLMNRPGIDANARLLSWTGLMFLIGLMSNLSSDLGKESVRTQTNLQLFW